MQTDGSPRSDRVNAPAVTSTTLPRGGVDLNRRVAYNVAAARRLRGWTQEELADRLAPHLGRRISQASVSAMERAGDSQRRRRFDAHKLLIFARVFDLPIVWFLLPQSGGTGHHSDGLEGWLLGRPTQLAPVVERLRDLAANDPQTAAAWIEGLTGQRAASLRQRYRSHRRELMRAFVDERAQRFERAVAQLGAMVDQLRQIPTAALMEAFADDEGATSDVDDPAGTPVPANEVSDSVDDPGRHGRRRDDRHDSGRE